MKELYVLICFVTRISLASTWRLTALLQARTAQMEQSLDHVSGVLRATLTPSLAVPSRIALSKIQLIQCTFSESKVFRLVGLVGTSWMHRSLHKDRLGCIVSRPE